MTAKEFVKEFNKFYLSSFMKDELFLKIALDDLAQKAYTVKDEDETD